MVGFKAETKFNASDAVSVLLDELIPQDLIKYGLIPELVGRIPVMATFSDLDAEALMAVLTQPKNAIIKQYQKLFSMESVELEFSEEALQAIARRSIQRRLGARGLRTIIEDLMLDLMFDLPSSKKPARIKITKRMVEEGVAGAERVKPAVGE